MKKRTFISYVVGVAAAAAFFTAAFFVFCPALNVHDPGLWVLSDVTLLVFVLAVRLAKGKSALEWYRPQEKKKQKHPPRRRVQRKQTAQAYLLPIAGAGLTLLLALIGSEMINAAAYSRILSVREADFVADLAETVGTDSIALMDTASAKMLGDREIGALSDLVSQFNVSDDYIQIDLNGRPVKVSALEYADVFKWFANRDEGVPGYVTVDPVSMSAAFHRTEGMKYVPSAWFFRNARRHLRMAYPTKMLGNLHFEIDGDGKPFYVASVLEKKVFVFGGATVCGCILLNPVTGETAYYAVEDVPAWVDVVFPGDLICRQYNWYGTLRNGYLNSLFAKRGCQQVTTIRTENDDNNTPPDYGYVAKDGDIWIYTGVTSVNGDSSNIGFLLSNERTGESRFYSVAGADENSAMTAAEGEVQEKGYQASFPSLINIDGAPTYIMVLKDSGGLVKLYAAVNVEQYNVVATAASQAECVEKYRALMGSAQSAETKVVTVAVDDVKYITVDGNTYVYLLTADGLFYRAKAADNEALLFVRSGDVLRLTCAGSEIVSFEKAN